MLNRARICCLGYLHCQISRKPNGRTSISISCCVYENLGGKKAEIISQKQSDRI